MLHAVRLIPSILSESDKNEIISVLKQQEKFWNKGDIDGFMHGYVKSDYLVFNGSSGPFYGWNSVKDRYIKTYPTKIFYKYFGPSMHGKIMSIFYRFK